MSITYKCDVCKKEIPAWEIRNNFTKNSEKQFVWIKRSPYEFAIVCQVTNNNPNVFICGNCAILLIKEGVKKLKMPK